ncbi:hypothetical protein [Streptococcus sobrinus]|uniref:hypothetical protein n=1 Tax=Streptococcus sobrinus TaxID=1310 RepID=UPI000373B34E|nr:hypothetical protein [Streptococcus sobrinus]
MNEFNKALDEVILACTKLSEEWEKIDATHADQLAKNYPFDKSFDEVIFFLKEWKENINK